MTIRDNKHINILRYSLNTRLRTMRCNAVFTLIGSKYNKLVNSMLYFDLRML